jgi:hypothetical protein
METVKLNFHLEQLATLIHNLDPRLRLELQVWCKWVSLKAPTDTRPSVDYFTGGAYRSYSLVSSWS